MRDLCENGFWDVPYTRGTSPFCRWCSTVNTIVARGCPVRLSSEVRRQLRQCLFLQFEFRYPAGEDYLARALSSVETQRVAQRQRSGGSIHAGASSTPSRRNPFSRFIQSLTSGVAWSVAQRPPLCFFSCAAARWARPSVPLVCAVAIGPVCLLCFFFSAQEIFSFNQELKPIQTCSIFSNACHLGTPTSNAAHGIYIWGRNL